MDTKARQPGSFTFLILRLSGLFLLLLPFFPIEHFFGEIKGIVHPSTPRQWLLGTLSVALLSVLLCWLFPKKYAAGLQSFSGRFVSSIRQSRPAFILSLFTATLFLCSRYAYHHRPHLIDSVVQYFQARIFAAGLLKAPLPPIAEFFMTQHMIFSDDGWYGQYPPLHSVLLMIGELLHFPWLSQWLLSIATVCLLYRFTLSVFDKESAIVLLILCCFSPFLLFMSSSFMNHVPTLFFCSLFLDSFRLWLQRNTRRHSFCAGLALGAAFLIRPLTAIGFGLVFALFGLHALRKENTLRAGIFGPIGFFSIAWILPLYNFLSNGAPFLTGYELLWGKAHGLGFHTSPWGESHGVIDGLRNELIDISLINEYLFESPIPGLMPLALFLLFSRSLQPWHLRLNLAFFAIPGCYFFYWHRDAFLGPRFLYETLMCLLPLYANGIVVGLRELRGFKIGSESFFRPIDAASLCATALCVCFIFIVSLGIPQRFTIDASSLTTMKESVLEKARAAGIEEGLILMKVTWGNRMIARLRGRGISASLAEVAYTQTDHCLLYQALERFENRAQLEEALHALIAEQRPLVRPANVKNRLDPTMRLDPNLRLTEQCGEELRYDRLGYTIYLRALAENSPRLDAAFVFARDLRGENKRILGHFPEKPVYRYDGKSFEKLDP